VFPADVFRRDAPQNTAETGVEAVEKGLLY
jgi:hypothetical protein